MKKGLLGLVAIGMAASVRAQFTPGRLVVSVVGDGVNALTSAATPTKLQEYALNGTPGFMVALPTTTVGSNRKLTMSGTATTEGAVTLSQNGRYLTFQGYDAAVGTLVVRRTDSSVVNRVVARIDSAGTVDTTTAFNAFSGSNIVSSVTVDGTAFWAGGSSTPNTSGGPWFVNLGGAGATQISTHFNDVRNVNIFGGQLYASKASGTVFGIYSIGTGLPMTAGQPMTLVLQTGTTTTDSDPHDYYFANASTCYVADDRLTVGGLQKWTQTGGVWSLAYTLNTGLTAGLRGVCATTDSGGITTIYAVTADTITATAGNKLVWVTDTGATSPFSTIATSAGNTAFRGVDFSPTASTTPITINPTTTTLAPGIVVSGTPGDMFTSNDMYYVLRPGVVLSSSQSPVVLTLSGNGPGNNPSDLKIVVESKGNQANIRETIEVYNFSTSSYEIVNQQVLTLSDVVKTLTIANPAQHVGAGNEVRAKLSYKAVGPILSYPWRILIDEATWRYMN